MGCKHCMQDSTPNGGHMTETVFDDAIKWIARHYAYATHNVLLITGGEPTEHPMFFDFMERLLSMRYYKQIMVVIVSNGDWLKDSVKTYKMRQLFSKYHNLSMQVSAFRKYYKSADFVEQNIRNYAKVSQRILIEDLDGELNIMDIGRARQNCRDELYDGNAACIPFLMRVKQLGLENAMKLNVRMFRYCTPMIDYRGYLHMSESIMCKPFGSIYDDDDELDLKARRWKPCMLCAQSKKLLDGSMQSNMIAKICNT